MRAAAYERDRALLTDKMLPQDACTRLFTPFRENHAYGWNVRTQDSVQMISHRGGINGFGTMIIRSQEKNICVVALANVLPTEAGKLASELFRLALGEEVALLKARTEISVKPENLDRCAGECELRPGSVHKIWRDSNHLMTQATGQPPPQFFAGAGGRFFAKVDATLILDPAAEGRMIVTLEQGGGRTKAPRKSPPGAFAFFLEPWRFPVPGRLHTDANGIPPDASREAAASADPALSAKAPIWRPRHGRDHGSLTLQPPDRGKPPPPGNPTGVDLRDPHLTAPAAPARRTPNALALAAVSSV